ARVERIVTSTSALTEYRSRVARLASTDVQGWIALARWADANALRTQAHEAWPHGAYVDPLNVLAQQALDHAYHAGRWMDRDDAMRAQGMIEYNGDWVTPTQMELRLRQRAEEESARRADAEAGARIAEAEARAREAEGRAAAADAAAARAADAYDDGGIPLDYVYGSGSLIGGFPIQPCCGLRHAPGA